MSSLPTRAENRLRPEHFERANKLPTGHINVNEVERWLSLAGGGALTLYGLQRGGLGGLVAVLTGGSLLYRGMTGHCPGYSALGLSSAHHGPATVIPAGHGVRVDEVITINRSPEELYRFWRNLENLPRFMQHLKAVHVQGNRSHWVAKGPLGTDVEWEAEIYNENPNEMIAWRSLEGADVDSTGSVHFRRAAGGRGTEMRVVLKYNPPAGKLGATLAKMFGEEPAQQIHEDLQRFKQLMEMGGASTTQGRAFGSNR